MFTDNKTNISQTWNNIFMLAAFVPLMMLMLGYCLRGNFFAESHLFISILPVPVFVSELVLIWIAFLALIKFSLQPVFKKQFLIIGAFFGSVFLLKVVGGYLEFGPLALRHAALFYYCLFAIFVNYLFKGHSLSKFLQPIILICLWAMPHSGFLQERYQWPVLVCALALSCSFKNKRLRWILFLFTLLNFPYHIIYTGTRSLLLSIMISLIVLVICFLFWLRLPKLIRTTLFLLCSLGIIAGVTHTFAQPKAIRSLFHFDEILIEHERAQDFLKTQSKSDEIIFKQVTVYNPNENFRINAERVIPHGTVKLMESGSIKTKTSSDEETVQNAFQVYWTTPRFFSSIVKRLFDGFGSMFLYPFRMTQKLIEPVLNSSVNFQIGATSQKTMTLNSIDDNIDSLMINESKSQSILANEERERGLDLTLQHPATDHSNLIQTPSTVPSSLDQWTNTIRNGSSNLMDNKTINDNASVRAGVKTSTNSKHHSDEASLKKAGHFTTHILFRYYLIQDAIKELQDRKPILGMPFGHPFRSQTIFQLDWARNEWYRDGWISIHNSLLHVVYRLGLLGVALIAMGLWWCLKVLSHFVKRQLVPGVFYMSMIMYWLFFSLFFPILELPHSAISFWLLVAAAWHWFRYDVSAN